MSSTKTIAETEAMGKQLPANKSAASIPMLHSEPHICVDIEEALALGRKDLVNLVRSRKLVLLVDLDHTLIHTTNEHVNPDMKVIKCVFFSCKT